MRTWGQGRGVKSFDEITCKAKGTSLLSLSYTYDAWGRELSWSTLNSGYAGLLYGNPLTYHGYIYDRETGFYYLQSRYYDPTVGRFLNADDTAFLGQAGHCWVGICLGIVRITV